MSYPPPRFKRFLPLLRGQGGAVASPLVPHRPAPYLCAMRFLLFSLAATALTLSTLLLPAPLLPAWAQSRATHTAASARPPARPAPTPPRAIGHYEDWTAAVHQEAGQTVCYAFTRAASSTPNLPGRGDVVLSVTQRPGGIHDAVAISAGFAYPANSEVAVQVEGTTLPFYTAQRSAFARDGRAAVAAFERGRQAVAKSPGPRKTTLTDTFKLRGFSPAFAAINKACGVKG